jgi:UDP-N-acetylglucosamine--N-acetylmuramyl-(pentapeptide) pyrophosphoryl-undecaprenol N-acetylglucosamine transferase
VSLRVLMAGGGSIGHVSPLLALAEELRRRDPETAFLCLGTATGLEATVLPDNGLAMHEIDRVPMPRRPSVDLLRLPSRLRRAVGSAREAIRTLQADVVVGFGGYVAMPAYLAARREHVPVVVHEQNALPGLANRFAARLVADEVAVSFVGTPLRGATFTGLPIRRTIADLDRTAMRAEARASFGLDPDAPTLLVTGGSQGARRLNDAVLAAAPRLAASGVGVLHVSGPRNPLPAPEQSPPYRVVGFLDRMELGYAAADLALCRSGANTVAEVAAVGLPAVFVPLPIGNGEQRRNAAGLLAAGGCLLIDDADVDADYVAGPVSDLVRDQPRLAAMAGVARELMPSDAAALLADLVERSAAGGRR